MLDDTFSPTDVQLKKWFDQAKTLAEFVYPEGREAQIFMENSHPATLGVHGTEQHLETPESLIKNYGEQGFDRVIDSLMTTLKAKEPKFFM